MNLFKKILLIALGAALVMASLPFVSVSAAGLNDPPAPTPGQTSNERLEKIWARQLRTYNRLGHVDQSIDKVQRLIDRAKANGRDVAAVQTALDAFTAAVKNAHPIYESMKGIANAHQGFDENGKVTDPVKARETVEAMREKLQEIKTTMNGTGQALHEAIRAFREANPRPLPAATPTGG